MTKSDQELRDKLASEFEDSAEPTGHIHHDMYSFKAGWDAARANDDMADYYEMLQIKVQAVAENDQLREEVERLNGLLARDTNVSPWPEKIRLEFTENQYTDEIKRLKAQCEKLAGAAIEAAEYANTDDVNGCAGEIMKKALAEYRAKKD